MKPHLITPAQKNLRIEPNLSNYDELYHRFSWEEAEREIEWFGRKRINAAFVAVDKNAKGFRRNKVALYWEGKEGQEIKYTFWELSFLSNRFGNLLRKIGVKRGERVFFFLPRIPELYIGFLGTLKIGALAGTLFSAFGPQALTDRLGNSGAKVLVTTPELLVRVEKIRSHLPRLKEVILVDKENRERFLEEKLRIRRTKTLFFYNELAQVEDKLSIAKMRPDDPAFILYTSGTTGKPKGVVHAHYAILQEHLTAKWVLDIHEEDVYWCTADPGWVTGVAYGILGAWSNGASSVVFEGRFSPERWYSLLEEYRVTVWYTAPTAIRMLMASGENLVKKYDLSSLRHLCSVGEPLNPEAIWWGLRVFGLPFHDTWWQTETGGILIANYPCLPIKIGSMGKPIPGIVAGIVDDQGRKLPPKREGNLAIRPGWPSQMRKIWRRPKKYQSYFINNWYISGDRAYRDEDGYFWFIGRADDVIKTAGERVGPFEVESALLEHPAVAEAAVIGKPDPIRGEIVKAFLVLRPGFNKSERLKKEIAQFVKKHLAGHAYPREIEFKDKLPKTRSGKIVRRILKAREMGVAIGDVSTLVEY